MYEVKHNKKFTVVYLTHYAKLFGANRSLIDLIKGIKKINSNFNPIVILPQPGAFTEALDAMSVQYFIIPFYNSIIDTRRNRFVSFIKSLAKLSMNIFLLAKNYKHLKQLKPDIIHSNTSIFTWGIWSAALLGKPHVQHIREFGKEDYNFEYDLGLRWYNYWLNKSKAVIAISKAIYAKRLQAIAAPVKQVIYNGIVFSDAINNDPENCLRSSTGNKENYVFGVMGNISIEKGQHTAIEALHFVSQHYGNASLIIAGTDEENYIPVLQKKINEYGLQTKVKFIGFVADIENFFKNIDCLLMCSPNEAFGRVTVEAMSFGVPVIGYDNAGTAEIIEDGYNGLLFKQDAEQLGDKMTELINNPKLAHTIDCNAKQTVKDNFTIEKYAASVQNLYTQLID